ncbi:MAG: ABC transporter permease, partial [Siphonobacter aquaeclarae]|nr:ABC transporter permease [Siphonobacter aquaeclarae]
MLLNYLKITLAVLKRHPFFTFVSLFGICFTMTVLIIVTAFVDDLASSGYPQPERDRNLYVNRVKLSSDQSQMMSNASLYLIRHYLDQLKTPDKIGFSGLMNT